MSCDDCRNHQNEALNKNIDESPHVAYFRIDEADVVILACKKHLLIIRARLYRDGAGERSP